MAFQKLIGYGLPSLAKEGWRAAPGWFERTQKTGLDSFIPILLNAGSGSHAHYQHVLGIIIRMMFMDTQQHHLSHIHVEYQGQRAVISIPDGSLLEGNLPAKNYALCKHG